ncbi:hypothetical protein [Cohnella cellulosilytica]|uniref:Polysaccharide deacetylase n=1 Tax=Cohnella cellulosilytica TaxID=986710 RepID=A0ABW2FAW9_9BACL
MIKAYPFTYTNYIHVLQNALQKRYKFVSFREMVENQKIYEKKIILRHDIDISLEKAHRMAKLEAYLNIKSIYFIMVSSEFYNVSSPSSKDILTEIVAMGHEIGLHFDNTAYKYQDLDEMRSLIFREAALLESIVNTDITAVSFHRPSREILEQNLNLNPMVNAYNHVFFNEIKYISDSRKTWIEKSIDEVINEDQYSKIQLLIHPIWWGEEETTFHDSFIHFTRDYKRNMFHKFSRNIRDFPEELKSFFYEAIESSGREKYGD